MLENQRRALRHRITHLEQSGLEGRDPGAVNVRCKKIWVWKRFSNSTRCVRGREARKRARPHAAVCHVGSDAREPPHWYSVKKTGGVQKAKDHIVQVDDVRASI